MTALLTFLYTPPRDLHLLQTQPTMTALLTFLLSCVLLTSSAVQPAPAPAPAADCSSLVANMVDCLSYVTVGGTAKKPEGTCCSGLKTVVKTDANCLCEAFKNSAQLGVTLDVSKALTLPAACHVSTPALSTCALSPGAAPAPSPMAMSPSSMAGNNEGAPAPSAGSSGSSVLTASLGLVVLMAVTSSPLF